MITIIQQSDKLPNNSFIFHCVSLCKFPCPSMFLSLPLTVFVYLYISLSPCCLSFSACFPTNTHTDTPACFHGGISDLARLFFAATGDCCHCLIITAHERGRTHRSWKLLAKVSPPCRGCLSWLAGSQTDRLTSLVSSRGGK